MSAPVLCRKASSLDSLMGELCLHAQDTLVAALIECRALKSARLTCRVLRDFVDSGVRKLDVCVRWEDRDRVMAGTQFPLSRWSRLTSLSLYASGRTKPHTLFGMILMHQPTACLQRIQELGLHACDLNWSDDAILVVSALLRLVPSLRRVSMRLPPAPDPGRQRALHTALESLPHLEHLTLTRCVGLPRHVGLLAGRLKHLVVDVHTSRQGELTNIIQTLASAVGQLSSLEALEVTGESLGSWLVPVVDSVQPNVRTVSVSRNPSHTCNLKLDMGQVVEVHGRFLTVVELVDFTADVLLRCCVLAERLRLLHLTHISITDEFPTRDKILELRRLVERCSRVGVDALQVEDGAAAAQVMEFLAVVGMPRTLSACCKEDHKILDVNLGGQVQQVQPPVAASAGKSERDWSSTDGRQMVEMVSELVLKQLTEGAIACAAEGCKAGPLQAAAAKMKTTAAGQGGGPSFSSDTAIWSARSCITGSPVHMLAVRSPIVATLASTPQILHAWVRQLLEGVEQFGTCTFHDPAPVINAWYLPLERSGAVLMDFESAGIASAMATVATTQLYAGGFEIHDSVCVHVVPHAFMDLQHSKAAQTFWDSCAATIKPTERLRLMVQLACELPGKCPVCTRMAFTI